MPQDTFEVSARFGQMILARILELELGASRDEKIISSPPQPRSPQAPAKTRRRAEGRGGETCARFFPPPGSASLSCPGLPDRFADPQQPDRCRLAPPSLCVIPFERRYLPSPAHLPSSPPHELSLQTLYSRSSYRGVMSRMPLLKKILLLVNPLIEKRLDLSGAEQVFRNAGVDVTDSAHCRISHGRHSFARPFPAAMTPSSCAAAMEPYSTRCRQ